MRIIYCFTSMLLALPLMVMAADSGFSVSKATNNTLNLHDALMMALAANPAISIAEREREANEGMQMQAATRRNPLISSSIEDTRNANRLTTIQIDQPLELGGKRQARMEAASAGLSAAESDIVTRKAEIAAAVTMAFYEVLAAQERMQLAASFVSLAEGATRIAVRRVEAGKVSPVEETKSRVAESSVRIEQNQAGRALNMARQRLAALWGGSAMDIGEAEGNLESLPLLPENTSLQDDLLQSPMMKRARLEIERREAITRLETSKRVPDLTVSLGAQRNQELGINQAVLGLSIPIPVFDRNQGNIHEAISRADKARDELLALQLNIRTNLSTAYEQWLASSQEAEALKQDILPGARSAFNAASKGFEMGKFNFLEVLDAQRTLFQAQSQYLNALLGVHRAHAEIGRLLGHFLPAAEPN
ncbi:TolC family protein [Methylobacillus gramineus]|uniref:TolC family protein n=1 Tax=Methylobacillus gramineus TaxID=755169 RepID=UPI001CFF6DB0|nr:TolC family protein [Methylobacillus gramineus]MCB5185962.1 TolC family protein [Methylobacillus gramineus]